MEMSVPVVLSRWNGNGRERRPVDWSISIRAGPDVMGVCLKTRVEDLRVHIILSSPYEP